MSDPSCRAIEQAFAEYQEANGFEAGWEDGFTGENALDPKEHPERFVLAGADWFTLNANDLFGWARADATECDGEDIPLLLEAIKRFGVAGEVAFQWKVRGMKEDVVGLPKRKWGAEYPAAQEWIRDKWLNADLERRIDELIEAQKNETGD